jgi:UV DNA damage repair endonuclease
LLSLKGKAAYDRLVELSRENLEGLDHTIDYNFIHNVRFYRCYSDIFPHISNRKLEG